MRLMEWLVWKVVRDELTRDSVNRIKIKKVISFKKPSSQSELQNEAERKF
jgi:hypothetical protein